VEVCERTMDAFTSQMEDNHHFILPGGTPLSAQLQFARVVSRRAERRLWTLNRQDELPPLILPYINRLSDLFFVMARYDMWKQQWPEEKWHSFTYKQKKLNKQE
ncbi:MAG: ATP:cob(I)alamin adenosyltransferase, partial [Oscillospiraceae bacterium]|nr:ATP:cob(I)alamin adenosyltransferase [Oscillospiraceae bacterium]